MAKAGLTRSVRATLTPEQRKAVSPWRCPNCGYTNDWHRITCDGCRAKYEDQEEVDKRRAARLKAAGEE